MSHKPSMPMASLEDQSPEVRAQLEAMTTPRNDGLPELPFKAANVPVTIMAQVREYLGDVEIRIADDDGEEGYRLLVELFALAEHQGERIRKLVRWQDLYAASVSDVEVDALCEQLAALAKFEHSDVSIAADAAALLRRASVGGVRVPDALSEHPRSSSYDQGWADGFTHCRDEVLRLNPAAEVGEVEALRLADRLEANDTNDTDCIEAAALLRRLAGLGKDMNR